MTDRPVEAGNRTPGARFHAGSVVLALALAVFTFGTAWIQLQLTPLGAPPDEMAHLTHVAEIARGAHLIPDYAHSRVLPDRKRGNYLGHPPLYYSTLGLTGRLLGWDPVRKYRSYRALGTAMVALGVLLWVLAGRALGVAKPMLVAAVAAANAIPMFPYLAGSINNDNLAYLAVAIAMCGAAYSLRWPGTGYWGFAAGLLVALLAKATAALFLLAFLAFWLAGRWRDGRPPWREPVLPLAIGLALAGAALYFLPTVLHYGTPFPRVATLAAQAPPPANPLGAPGIVAEFARQMWSRLPTVASHASLAPLAGPPGYAVYALLLLPLGAWALDRRGAPRSDSGRIADAFLLALLATLLVHLAVVWRTYAAHGVFAGLQPRYYSYALPGLFVLCFAGPNTRAGRVAAVAFALVAAALIAIAPARTVEAQLERASTAPSTRLHLRRMDAPPSVHLALRPGAAGNVDRAERKGSELLLSGWAIDTSTEAPAGRVWIWYRDRMVGIGPTGQARPDVAAARGSLAAGRAGFRFVMDGIDEPLDVCALRVAAEQGDGQLVLLRQNRCGDREP